MSAPTERTAGEFLEVLMKVRRRTGSCLDIQEVLYLLVMGVYRQGVFDGGGQEALDKLDRRHHAVVESGGSRDDARVAAVQYGRDVDDRDAVADGDVDRPIDECGDLGADCLDVGGDFSGGVGEEEVKG